MVEDPNMSRLNVNRSCHDIVRLSCTPLWKIVISKQKRGRVYGEIGRFYGLDWIEPALVQKPT